MSIPKSKTDTRQQLLVSDCDRIQPLRQGEVRISHQSHHGVEPLASDQGILCPTPWPGVQQFVPDGQQPAFPSVLPLSNTVPSPGSWPMSGLKQPHPAYKVFPVIPPDSYSGSDDEYGVDTFELPHPNPPNSEPSSDEEHGVDPPELRGFDDPHGRLPASCELLGPDSLSSNKLPEVGSPPWPFAGDMSSVNLARLNQSTLPMLQPPQPPQPPQSPQPPQLSIVQNFDTDAIRERLLASLNPQQLMVKALVPERRSHLVDKPAMPRALLSEQPAAREPVAFVAAVQGLSLTKAQRALRALANKNSYEEMVEFAKTLTQGQIGILLDQLWRWVTTPDLSKRNPEAASLMALLLLFTTYTPSLEELDEFMKILPLTWPPALEHLRRECLDRRASLYYSRQRDAFHARLNARYRD